MFSTKNAANLRKRNNYKATLEIKIYDFCKSQFEKNPRGIYMWNMVLDDDSDSDSDFSNVNKISMCWSCNLHAG